MRCALHVHQDHDEYDCEVDGERHLSEKLICYLGEEKRRKNNNKWYLENINDRKYLTELSELHANFEAKELQGSMIGFKDDVLLFYRLVLDSKQVCK